ncbi:ABC transporter ATP-binding protein [soil metagenome]
MASISLEGIRREHPDGTVSLDGIDLHIAQGEMVAVIGPSGSGKTTLLKVVAGIDEPQAGLMRIDGRPAEEMSLRDRDFAYLPQGATLLANRDVAGQMAFPLEIRGHTQGDIRRRVNTEGRFLGLGRLMRRRPHELSAGEAQRVAMGRTRTRVPQALLLDEPMSKLDAPERARLRHELRTYQQGTNLTVVLATNDHDEALVLADRIVVLRQGRIVQIDTPEGLLRQPAGEWQAGFVGDPPMGVVDAILERQGGLAWFEVAGQRLRIPGGLPGPLADHVGFPVRLGSRPHMLHPPTAPDEAVDRRVQATVDHLIPVPGQTHAALDLPGGRWLAPFPHGTVDRGDTVEVVANVRAMSVFDLSGRAIWHGG